MKPLTEYVRRAYARISRWGGGDSLPPLTDLSSSKRTENDMDDNTCKRCRRNITEVDGTWVDPNATGDDSVWRETCDANDTERAAPHEPAGLADRDGTYTPDIEDRRRIAVSNLIFMAFNNDGMIMPGDLLTVCKRNIVSNDELDQLGIMVTKRMVDIARGSGF